MICTSSYREFRSELFRSYSISADKGKGSNYSGNSYVELAPKKAFWKLWRENIGKISSEKNNLFYVEEYWKQVLSKLDPEKVYRELDYSVLLCHETHSEFCHRHLVAVWLEIFLDIKVPEIEVNSIKVTRVERSDYYINTLLQTIKNNKDMRGFDSVRALYLFEKAEKQFEEAKRHKISSPKLYDSFAKTACILKFESELAEKDKKP